MFQTLRNFQAGYLRRRLEFRSEIRRAETALTRSIRWCRCHVRPTRGHEDLRWG